MLEFSYTEFDEDQKTEIQLGEEASVDVSIYANPKYLAIQMRQIRLGLMEGLDVSAYSSPKYDWFQMEEIRLGVKQGVNYSLYANPAIDYKRMREIRQGLIENINLSPFAKLHPGILREMRKAIKANVSIVDYIKEGYDVEQLEEIRIALEMQLDIRPYICPELMGMSIHEIRLGLEKRLPVSIYANLEYSWMQMREIRLGLEINLDVDVYRNPYYSWDQMREIRLGMEAGLDVNAYKSLIYTAQEMERIRLSLMENQWDDSENACKLESDLVTVFVSNNQMEACIEINCEPDVELTPGQIKMALKEHGIVYGILEDEVQDIVDNKKYKQTIVIAEGTPPQAGQNGYYEFFFDTAPSHEPVILEDGTADFRQINWYVMIGKGEKIAYYHSATEGVDGKTVKGKVVRGRRGRDKSVLSGKNFILLEDKHTYVSAISGKIDLVSETRVEISHLWILEEANLSTGDVEFDGSILVQGNVSGVTLKATENIVINGYVEGARVICNGDVCLRMGMNGTGNGYIETNGSVVGQFFEATRIVAGANVSAHYCMNCEIYAQGIIKMHGEDGRIVGGYTKGARGIISDTIGNHAKVRTCLSVGPDIQFVNQQHELERKIESVEKELQIFEKTYKDFQKKYSPEVRNVMEIYIKVENAIYTKKKEMEVLEQQREQMKELAMKLNDAAVEVDGILNEGVEVTIGDQRWKSFETRSVAVVCHNKRIIARSK